MFCCFSLYESTLVQCQLLSASVDVQHLYLGEGGGPGLSLSFLILDLRLRRSRSHGITPVSSQLLVEVRPGNVSPCVCTQKLQRTALTISMKLCNYLGIDILRKMFEPDFRKKIWFLIKKIKRAFLGTLKNVKSTF